MQTELKINNIEIFNIEVNPEDNNLYIDLYINGKPFEDLQFSIDNFKYQFNYDYDKGHSIENLNHFIKLLKK